MPQRTPKPADMRRRKHTIIEVNLISVPLRDI